MNTPGIPRLTFVVDAVDDVFDRLRAHGAELVGEVAQYGDIYRYCYVRGPAGHHHRAGRGAPLNDSPSIGVTARWTTIRTNSGCDGNASGMSSVRR